MATSSKPGIGVPAALIPGDNKGSVKANEDLTMVQANAVMMNDYLPAPSPPEQNTITVQGFTSGMLMGSAEYALSVIGVLCIVYGIVAK
jgi:hypothetical protein